jgi:hypothetical protein
MLEVRDTRRELQARVHRAKTWSESPPPSVWRRRVETSLR